MNAYNEKCGGTVQTWTCFPLNLYLAPESTYLSSPLKEQLSCSKNMNNISTNQAKTYCWCWTKLSKHIVRLSDMIKNPLNFQCRVIEMAGSATGLYSAGCLLLEMLWSSDGLGASAVPASPKKKKKPSF